MKKAFSIFAIFAMFVLALTPMVTSANTGGTVPPEVLLPEPWVANGDGVFYDDVTKHAIKGDFLFDYLRFGLDMGHEGISYEEALALTGRPLTSTFDEINPDTGEKQHVQYFERARLEFHPEFAGTEFIILRELLGTKAFTAKSDKFGPEVKNPAQPINNPDCQFFPETQHNMCGGLLNFWLNNGGVMGLGYPIMEATHETMPDGTVLWVQYTERARLEEHPENKYPYNVLLGRLGAEFLEMRLMQDDGGGNPPPPPAPTPTPTPTPPPSNGGECTVVHEYQLKDLTEVAGDSEFIHVQFWWEGVPERETLFPPGRYSIPAEWSEGKLRGMVWELGGPNCTAEAALRDHLKPSMDRRVNAGVNHAGYLHWTWLIDQKLMKIEWQPNPVPTVPDTLP